jgi:predicted nucleic acid-binding protein
MAELDHHDLPDLGLISTITLGELAVGPLVATEVTERATRQARLLWARQVFDPLPFDTACSLAFGGVGAELRLTGHKTRARGFDAMIAATAIANGLPLFTLNPDDFAGITGLDLRVPTLTHDPT